MSTDGSQCTEQSTEPPQTAAPSVKTSDRPTTRTALRDLERTQFDALEAAQLRDLDR